MPYFTKVIDKCFAAWILSDTWYTPNDIEDNFYRFIIAIHNQSQAYTNRKLREEHDWVRHPRTYDKQALIDKILLAVERNHENFDRKEAQKLVTGLADEAMIILNALWFGRIAGSHRSLQDWNPPLRW